MRKTRLSAFDALPDGLPVDPDKLRDAPRDDDALILEMSVGEV